MQAQATAMPGILHHGTNKENKELVSSFGFFCTLVFLLLAAALLTPYPNVAQWFAFLIAAYSAVANDSIQTIGTFLSSNTKCPWWVLWIFISFVFVATILYSYFTNHGDVSFGRLDAKGFSVAPKSFSFLQLAAPIGLLLLTRFGLPVSTTFLLLSSMATSALSVGKVLTKSVSGYVVAFLAAFLVYLFISRWLQRRFHHTPKKWWNLAQWLSTATLWSVWIMQDAANLAVYLPRRLSGWEVSAFLVAVVAGLGGIFFAGGGKMQKVVSEKAASVDVRSATVIDFIYALILIAFKEVSNIPMSTTWVFVGMLAGREVAMHLTNVSGRKKRRVIGIVFLDWSKVTIGLAVSLVLAIAANETFRKQLFLKLHALFA